jgi:two-component system response regulator NreC
MRTGGVGRRIPCVMCIGILLVDDHRIFREGLRVLLEKQPGIRVLAEAEDGRQAVQLAREHHPDVVIMDVSMPQCNGIEATKLIMAEAPGTKVLALSIHSDGNFVIEMLRAGAAGYLLKDCCHQDLARAIRTVDANVVFLSPCIALTAAKEYIRHNSGPNGDRKVNLTGREKEVLLRLAGGKTTKEIAQEFGVSAKTIETYRWRLRQKLNMRSMAELTKYAIRQGLVSVDS